MPAPDDTRRSTALQQGNHALRHGDPAQAIRHYALGLVDEPSHGNGPIAAQLAANLVRARRRYRQARRQGGAPLQVAVTCWSLSENPLGRAQVLASLYQALAEEPASGISRVIGSVFARRGRALWPPLRDAFHQGPDPAPGPSGAIPLHSMSLATAFDGLSVVNRALQQRHGGVIVRHARATRGTTSPAARPPPRAGAGALADPPGACCFYPSIPSADIDCHEYNGGPLCA